MEKGRTINAEYYANLLDQSKQVNQGRSSESPVSSRPHASQLLDLVLRTSSSQISKNFLARKSKDTKKDPITGALYIFTRSLSRKIGNLLHNFRIFVLRSETFHPILVFAFQHSVLIQNNLACNMHIDLSNIQLRVYYHQLFTLYSFIAFC